MSLCDILNLNLALWRVLVLIKEKALTKGLYIKNNLTRFEFGLGYAWRKRWDSNPRYVAVYLISSQGRYDHFDTLPYFVFAQVGEIGPLYSLTLVAFATLG